MYEGARNQKKPDWKYKVEVSQFKFTAVRIVQSIQQSRSSRKVSIRGGMMSKETQPRGRQAETCCKTIFRHCRYRWVIEGMSVVDFQLFQYLLYTGMQKKGKQSKFSNWMKMYNGEQQQPVTNQLQLTLRTHTYSQSNAEILISPDFNLGVQVNDIVLIQIEQPTDYMLAQVSAQSLEENPISKHQISVLRSIADLYPISYDEKGLRFKAKVKKLNENNFPNYQVEFVEVLLKDQCISQYDRYRIAKQLVMHTIYPLKTLSFEKIRVQIFNLLSNGDIPKMGILTQNTKVIYRTGSSNHTILIEFTRDMFDLDYYQQMYVERVVEFLKVYTLRNSLFQVNHNMEIVLFARMFYPQFKTLNEAYDFMVGEVEKLHSEEASKINSINLAVAFQKDTKDRIYEDCYRKIIWCQHYGSLTAFVWKKIGEFLYTINWKQNIKPLAVRILQRVQTQMAKADATSSSSLYGLGNPDLKIRPFIHFLQCELSDSQTCNILEAIILAAEEQGKHYYGMNLTTTGNALTVLSAGHSRYYTDPATYRLAKYTVYLTNISCSLINLRQKKPQLQIIQIMGPSNLVEQNSDSKMNSLIYGCLDALIYSSPLYREPYQHPHCFQNRMAIKLSHLKEITKENQSKYFKNIKLEKLSCGHEVHFVLKEDMDFISSTTSYQQRLKMPEWINYCYFGKKALRVHNKYYEIKEGQDPAKLYLYGQINTELQVLPIYRHADEQLFEVTSLNNNKSRKLVQKYNFNSSIEDLCLKFNDKSNLQIALFENQVCPKVYLTNVIEPILKKHDSGNMLTALTKAVFQEDLHEQRTDRIQSENKVSKKKSKNVKKLTLSKGSSIFQNDTFSLSEMELCMFFSNFARRVSSQFKSRQKHNFINLPIHYLMPWFSQQTIRSLKATIFRDTNNAEFTKIHREFDMEWNWKFLCFPLLTPITTVADIEGLRIIPRQNITSTNPGNVKLLVGQKLSQGFQLIEDPEKIAGDFQKKNQCYRLIKGHLYYPIQVLGSSNMILKECQVIDKNSKTSRRFPNNQDLIKALEQKYSDMLYRYLCYQEKQFRFVPKRTYFKNDNSWHKVKYYNERSIKISLIIDTSTEETVDREKYRTVCSESFKEFIHALNQKFKNVIPNFMLQVREGPVTEYPIINRIPIKLCHLNPQLQIFRNDSFFLNYQASWNPRCTYNIMLSWNGCLGLYINQFLNTLLSMAKFGRKIMPCFVPSQPCIFQNEWKFESPAEIIFTYQLSMDLLVTSMEERWVWDRNGFFFNKDGFSFVKFQKERKLLLWKDNYKQIVEAKQVPESQFFNFFIKACVYDIIGEMIEKMFHN